MNKVANYDDIAGYICEVSKYDRSNGHFSENSIVLAKAFIKQIGDINHFASTNSPDALFIQHKGFNTDKKIEAFFEENKAQCLELMREAIQEQDNNCSSYISSIAPEVIDEAEMFTGYMLLISEKSVQTKDSKTLNIRQKFINGFVRDIYSRIYRSFRLYSDSCLF